MGCLFQNNVIFVLRSGCSVKFWSDPWVEGKIVSKDRFLGCSSCHHKRKGMLEIYFRMRWSLGCLCGDKFFNANEMLNFLDLWNCICRYKINIITESALSWLGNLGSKFTTKDVYKLLSNERLGVDGDLFPWEKLWWKAVPMNVEAFSWKVIWERISSKNNLLKRGLCFGGDPNTCSVCLSVAESSNHLIFTCPSTIMVWSVIMQWLEKSVLCYIHAKDYYLEFLKIGKKFCEKEGLGACMAKHYLEVVES